MIKCGVDLIDHHDDLERSFGGLELVGCGGTAVCAKREDVLDISVVAYDKVFFRKPWYWLAGPVGHYDVEEDVVGLGGVLWSRLYLARFRHLAWLLLREPWKA
jgi:hypothetical protein